MRFSMLTAMTLALAMVAGTAQAQGGVNQLRTVHLTSPVWGGPSDGEPTGGGEPKGKFNVSLDNEIFGEGAGFQLNLRSFSCPGAINWAEGDPAKEFFENLSLQSRIVWVLYVTVGGETTPSEYPQGPQTRRIITFRPDCSSYGTTWAQTQINGYLVDNNEVDPTLWNERVMTDSLTVEIWFEVIDRDELEDPPNQKYFEGSSPAVQ